jgi:L-ectoine synthase
MKVVRICDIRGTDREVKCPQGSFTSFRALLASDGMGFSVHKTVLPPGPPQFWHYKNHLEACYCIAGKALVTEYDTGRQWLIYPDCIYVLDKNDRHTFQALEETVLISIFNPPVTGSEVHDEDGSYQLAEVSHV